MTKPPRVPKKKKTRLQVRAAAKKTIKVEGPLVEPERLYPLAKARKTWLAALRAFFGKKRVN